MKTSSHSAPSLRVLVRSSAGPTSTSSVVWVRELARNKDSVVSTCSVSPVVEFLAGLGGGAGRGGGVGLRIAGVFRSVDRAEYAAEVHIRSRAGLQEAFRG